MTFDRYDPFGFPDLNDEEFKAIFLEFQLRVGFDVISFLSNHKNLIEAGAPKEELDKMTFKEIQRCFLNRIEEIKNEYKPVKIQEGKTLK
ncbi:hypothetical protein [Cohnella sp. AR92]|uniref:hypothetical protein n=1 Tax=Cohnella sp. AR92 TaxID=648716 RepID=UPI000F8E5A38|nr:hypothetical protein [Cohnella sp. AR92]RUS44895.1 hypothetical protein ELR57_21805 [Cohnella sp. AR92]